MGKHIVILLLIGIVVTAESRLLLRRELIERSEDRKEGEFSEASYKDPLPLRRELIERSEDMKEGDTKEFSEASNKDPFNPREHDPRHN